MVAGTGTGWLRRINWPLTVAVVILTGLAALAILAPYIAPYGPNEITGYIPKSREAELGYSGAPPFPPMPAHPLGTDLRGHDLLSRLLFGIRYTLGAVIGVVSLQAMVALPLGLWAGVRGRWLLRSVRSLGRALSGFPQLVFAYFLLQPITYNLDLSPWAIGVRQVATIALLGLPVMSEQVADTTRVIGREPYIEGARASGARSWEIIRYHILPHLWSRLAAMMSLEASGVLWLLGQLAIFQIYLGGIRRLGLGRGAAPLVGEWGSMLAEAFDHVTTIPYWPLSIAVAFFTAIVAFNLAAEGLRQRIQA